MDAGGWVMPPLVFLLLVLWFAIGYRFTALATRYQARCQEPD